MKRNEIKLFAKNKAKGLIIGTVIGFLWFHIEVAHRKKIKVYFIANFILEIVLLNLVYIYCTKNHVEELIVFALTIVVGLHFIPMAVFMKIRQYFICSIIMIVSGIIFLVINNPVNNLSFIIAQSFISAVALWLTVTLSIKDVQQNLLEPALSIPEKKQTKYQRKKDKSQTIRIM